MHKVSLKNAAGSFTTHTFDTIEQAHGQVGPGWPVLLDGHFGHFEFADDTSTETIFIAYAPGQYAFSTYNDAGQNPGKDWRGNPVPTWGNLTDDVRAKWAAVEATLRGILTV